MQIMSAQNDSASRTVTTVGLRIGDSARVKLLVGVTPDATVCGEGKLTIYPEVCQMHFCSARWQIHHRLSKGGEQLLPQFPEIFYDCELPRISEPSFVDAYYTLCLRESGEIVIAEPRFVRAVTVPEEVLERTPWATANGDFLCFGGRGFKTVHEWFQKEGRLLMN